MTSGYEKELDAQDPLWRSLLQAGLAMLAFVLVLAILELLLVMEPTPENLNAVGQMDWGATLILMLAGLVVVASLVGLLPHRRSPED